MTTCNEFEDALDLLIATSITCLKDRDFRLKRAIEIAVNYRSLSPKSPPAISLQQFEVLGAWLAPQRVRGDQ